MRFLTKWIVGSFFIVFLGGCNPQSNTKTVTSDVIDSSLCQFQQGVCKLNVNSVDIMLMINPVFTPSEKPLSIDLHFSVPVTDVKMRIEGRDMFMGVIPVNLTAEKNSNPNHYKGSAIYGSCSSNYMVWRALVNYSIDGKPQSTWFDFLADNK
ncbi:hypothetical protein [Shewanella sp. 10N.286.48.A6]|uniref:hypothetical protein n=1 Tax=Shewanella sp. 10N.286.48.A6 TaxID=1880833 RepID=UPI000C825698|nr:hypothetical protein [Shewanella sp. 10N.286.48.A6]